MAVSPTIKEEKMKAEDSDIGQDIVNTILERPYLFKCEDGKREFYIYPKTLGKVLLVSEMLKGADIDEANLRTNPYGEALRVCRDHKELVCRIVAVHAAPDKASVFDEKAMDGRMNLAMRLNIQDIAKLFILLLADDELNRFCKHFGIDKEREWQEKALKAKKDNSTLTFGGKSVYGTLIDNACQRYGWTFDYVVWGISYTNLRMLMADAVNSVFLTDEERKRVHIPNDRNVVNMDDPRNKDIIKQMHWD